jgi:hypothetical protein
MATTACENKRCGTATASAAASTVDRKSPS